jgi:hypothetical protein
MIGKVMNNRTWERVSSLYLRSFGVKLQAKREMRAWERAERIGPPPHQVKQHIVLAHAKAFCIETFIESGTYRGDMVLAMAPHFRQVFSIELSPALFAKAKIKLSSFDHVEIIQGDSGEKIRMLVAKHRTPCIFWLDGHYSGGITARGESDTPIMKEIEAILSPDSPDHVVLIDDARCFNGTNGYPTLSDLKAFAAAQRPTYLFSLKHDVIRIHAPIEMNTNSQSDIEHY